MRQRHLYPALLLSSLILLAIVVSLGYSLWRHQVWQRASQALAVSVTESILASGDAAALLNAAHADLLEEFDALSLRGYVETVARQLGPLQVLESVTGSVEGSWLPWNSRASAQYTIGLQFAHGDAEATVTMIKPQDVWQIAGYQVDSPLLYN